MTAQRRASRERLRLEATAPFAVRWANAEVARQLRVHVRSVQRWRQAWSGGSQAALRSKGPASYPALSDELFAMLEAELAKGLAAHGWQDRHWTLGRIKTLIGRRFHNSYTERGVRLLLKRHGYSWQVPARRTLKRDEQTIAS